MNAFVGLAEEPSLIRNSLILTGLTFRTFSNMVSVCVWPFTGLVQEASPMRSPLKANGPEVTLKVALTLAPGTTGSAKTFEVFVVPGPTAVHPLGTRMRSSTPIAAAPVVLVKVTVVSREDRGAEVL